MAAAKNLIATGGPNTASSPVMLTSAEETSVFYEKKRERKNVDRNSVGT